MVDHRLGLGDLLLVLLGLALGGVELVGLLGDERLDGLLRVARDDVEPGRSRGELAFLHGELGLLVLQGLGRVDDGGLGARLRLDELRAHVDALLQRRDQVLLGRDGSLQRVALGRLLRLLGVERGDRRCELPQFRRQHALLAGAQALFDVGGPGDRRKRRQGPGARGGHRRMTAQAFGLGRGAAGARRPRVGLGGRGVELDEDVARLDRAVVPDVDRDHAAGLDGLDHLDASVRLELALRRGDDVDPPEIRRGPGRRRRARR